MTDAAERKALNEAAFRNANETLERGARELVDAGGASLVPFLCECPKPDCTQVVLLTLREYEHIRGRPFGVTAIGHDDPSIERVVAENDRFVTTEKFGAAGEMHGRTDPRG